MLLTAYLKQDLMDELDEEIARRQRDGLDVSKSAVVRQALRIGLRMLRTRAPGCTDNRPETINVHRSV